MTKTFNKLTAALLVIIFLFGVLISCTPAAKQGAGGENITFETGTINFSNSAIAAENITDEASVITPENIKYEEAVYLEDLIYYEFGEYVDDVYVVNLQKQDYINSKIIISPAREISLEKIIGNIVIGEGVMLAAAVALAPISGGQSVAAFIVIWHTKALAGAAAGAAIEGISEYISSGGNIDSTFSRALEGASEGYKWGAVLAVGEDVIKTARFARAVSKNKTVTTNFSESALSANSASTANLSIKSGDDVSKIYKYSDDVVKNMKTSEIGAFRQYTRDENNWIDGYKKINDYLRNGKSGKVQESVKKAVKNMDDVLNSCKFPVNRTLYRGMNMSAGDITKLLGQDILDNSLKNIDPVKLNKLAGKSFMEKAFTSVSLDPDVAYNFAKHGDEIPVLIEINNTMGAKALAMTDKLSMFSESEVLIKNGQQFLIKNASYQSGGLKITADMIL